MAYDAGTGRNWCLFRYSPTEDGFSRKVRVAHEGVVVWTDDGLTYDSIDGQSRVLFSEEAMFKAFEVSPDGSKVAVNLQDWIEVFYEGATTTGVLVVLDVASGAELLRMEDEDILNVSVLARLDLEAPEEVAIRLDRWTQDSAGIVLGLVPYSYDAEPGGILTLDGDFRMLPRVAEPDHSNLSPDGRYLALGRPEGSDAYSSWNWRSIDVIDVETGRVLRSVQTPGPLQEYHWEWATATRFAWPSGTFPDVVRLRWWHIEPMPTAEVSVIDVTTGEIEVMEAADYRARFHPPARARTECPGNTLSSCRVILDDEIVWQWRAGVIGVVDLD